MISYILGGAHKSHMQIASSLGSVPVGKERERELQRLEGVASVEPQVWASCVELGEGQTQGLGTGGFRIAGLRKKGCG